MWAVVLQRGSVLIDGTRLPDIQHQWLHSQVHTVFNACTDALFLACIPLLSASCRPFPEDFLGNV